MRRRLGDVLFPYALVAPSLLLVLGISFYPTFYAILLSFHKVSFITMKRFVGLANYERVLEDPLVWNSLKNSFVFVFGSMLGAMGLGLILALMLNRPVKLRGVFRSAILIPWVVAQVVSMSQLKWVLNYDYGLINAALAAVGLGKLDFLAAPANAMASLILGNVWRSAAYSMILLLAGLQTIPSTLYEAARIDGASETRTVLAITLPLLKMPLLITAINITISYFTIVIPQMVLTGGGPGVATETLSLRMFTEAFTRFQMATASVMGVVLFIINLALCITYMRVLRTERYY